MSFFERLKTEASAEWRAYTEHPFTNGLADGSLAEAAFRHYLVQDYLFLTEFARAYALSVYKSPKLADMREAAAGLSAILDIEMNLHVKLCAGWGLSPSDLEQTPPAVEMLAYKARNPYDIRRVWPPAQLTQLAWDLPLSRDDSIGRFKKSATALIIRQRHCRFFEETQFRLDRVTPI
jgi:hypothetical protein